MGNSQYAFDNEWARARTRLSAMERIEDPATIDHLERIGVAEGWNCLEVGAGGGSITAWLSRRVGPTGCVVATDLNTRLLEMLDFPQLNVLKHDVIRDDLEASKFDLVHARNLLIHIPERSKVLQKIAAAVKPGGWMLIEESDFVTNQANPGVIESFNRLYEYIVQETHASLESRGVDCHCGAHLPNMLQSLGFESLGGEGRASLFQGGSVDAECQKLTFEQLKDDILARRRVTEQELCDFLALFENPSFSWRGPLRVSVYGRRPQH